MLRPITHDSSHQNLSGLSSQSFDGLNHSGTISRHEGCLSQTSHLGKLSIRENSNHFMVSLEFDQFDDDSLELWIEDHQLALIADKQPQFCLKGRKPSSFICSINLPGDVDEASMEAALIDTKLEIRFTKDRINSSSEF
ncbi:MAG: Hsp20/alpha crystallin family protein [Pseudobdellovibrionaceae bacterium]|nr:Hsp20/alpha crystallin family protein [Pseudobdellovibrionaceae bacterium]